MSAEASYAPSPAEWVRTQVEKYETSGGTEGNTLRGVPVIVLTSVGAKTGLIRKTPLMRVENDGVYAVVASQGGAPKNPVWYYNLLKQPLVQLQDGPTRLQYLAREISGEEKKVWWERCIAVWPDYAEYQTKTDREIPVFVLEPRP
jgi:deazaflavin-dependent oxidoreductase (nitroreductase family)